MSEISVGKKAPAFSGTNAVGEKVSLKGLVGEKGIILYFYPKDSTPGCTTEACDFRDNIERLQGQGYTVVGVSKDSVNSHQKFTEKNSLNFQLISDEDGSICDKYGVFGEKKFMGKTVMGIRRTTLILDASLKIQKIYNNVKVKGHIEQILSDIKEI
jgi:thioredoxin-dependent peroxiredoxin